MRSACRIIVAASVAITALAVEAAPELRLRYGSVDTTAKAEPSQLGRYAIVQFASAGLIDLAALRATGAQPKGYLPDHAYVVDLQGADLDALRALAGLHWLGPYRAEYKYPPSWEKTAAFDRIWHVTGFRGEPLGRLRAAVSKAIPGIEILHADEQAGVASLRLRLPLGATLGQLARIDEVVGVQPWARDRLENDESAPAIQANSALDTPFWDAGITGTGEVVTVLDSGLDRNEEFFVHWHDGNGVNTAITNAELVTPPAIGTLFPDRKVVGYWYPPDASPYDDNETCGDEGTPTGYHGTHVTGSVAGDSGTTATPTEANHDRGDGMAPNAQILFQDIGDDATGCLTGDLGRYDRYKQAFDAGSRIATTSTGASIADDPDNAYNFLDYQADRAAYDYEDLVIFNSAGNEGPESNTLTHTAVAKHTIAVGRAGHGIVNSVAPSSSRGPTFDGRVKPDIVAPGSGIVSAAGDDNDGANIEPPEVSTKSGTSMAAPTAAGGAALLRQYFREGYYPSGSKRADDALIPSGSLMAATIINGTRIPTTGLPTDDWGWGRMYLDNNVYFPGDARDLRVWDRRNAAGLRTGESETFRVQVGTGASFRATLVWRDPAQQFAAVPALVNDLDLEVRSPDGTLYRGNVFSGARSTTGGSADRLNVVEQVRFIAPPQAGEYEITVRAASVPGDGTYPSQRQGFALAVSSEQCATGVSQAPSLSLSTNDEGVLVSPGTAAGATAYQVYRAEGSCSAPAGPYSYVGTADATGLLDDSAEGTVRYAYRLRGVDACGEGPVSACTSIVSEALCAIPPEFDITSVRVSQSGTDTCDVVLSWDGAEAQCGGAGLRYNIYRSTDPLFEPSAATLLAAGVPGNTYTDTSTTGLVTYHYAVRAVDTLGNEQQEFLRRIITPTGTGSEAATFVDDPDEITLVDLGGVWQVSSEAASTGQYSYNHALAGTTYPPQTCARVTTPPLQLQSGSPVLSYDARYELEVNWDGVVVEVSTDGGSTWRDLPPEGGYPGTLSLTEPDGFPINECGYRATQGAFTGSSTNFASYQSSLAAYAGQEVVIRWSFTSDPGSEDEGFFLDNIRVTEASTPRACQASDAISGPWYNTAQSGHGWLVERLDPAPGSGSENDRVLAYWYVYNQGEPAWLIGQGDLQGDTAVLETFIASGPDFPPNYRAEDFVLTPWGEMTFTFATESAAHVAWDTTMSGFTDGELEISRLASLSKGPEACRSGSYYDPEENGHGFVIEVLDTPDGPLVLAAWYVYLDGDQVWLLGQGPLSGDVAELQIIEHFSGTDFPPNFEPQEVIRRDFGTLTIAFTGPDSADISWDTVLPEFTDGSMAVQRLTQLKGRACP